MKQKFKKGDVVKIRNEQTPARVVMPIKDDDGGWWYEVEAVGLANVPTREVKQADLKLA